MKDFRSTYYYNYILMFLIYKQLMDLHVNGHNHVDGHMTYCTAVAQPKHFPADKKLIL